MHRVTLNNTSIESTQLEKLHLFLDANGSVILLPMLWAIHLETTGSVYKWETVGSVSSNRSHRKYTDTKAIFKANDIAVNTAENYIGHLYHFLRYIENEYSSDTPIDIHNTESINSYTINHYLNTVLPIRVKSEKSLTSHYSGILAYYNFLFSLEIKQPISISISRKTRQYMAEQDTRPKKISYISRDQRKLLIETCNNKRDKLILRMGYEVGLRAGENYGLVLGQHKAKRRSRNGLIKLFNDLEKHPNKCSFEFTLNGEYTKGGRTRTVYFDRELLTAMKDYYDTERQEKTLESANGYDTLFVRHDNAGKGLPISSSHASRVFNKLLKQRPHLNQILSYHDLRHTFATTLYHTELLDTEGRETRSESAALIVVAERLGHSLSSNRYNSFSTTKRYIRLREKMLTMEEYF